MGGLHERSASTVNVTKRVDKAMLAWPHKAAERLAAYPASRTLNASLEGEKLAKEPKPPRLPKLQVDDHPWWWGQASPQGRSPVRWVRMSSGGWPEP